MIVRHTQAKALCQEMRSEFVAIALLLSFTLSCLDADLLVVFFKCCKIFTSLTELTLLHSFTDIPVHECTLAVHQIKLVVNARENFCNCCGVADHAYGSHHLCKVTTRYDSGWLIIDTALEA